MSFIENELFSPMDRLRQNLPKLALLEKGQETRLDNELVLVLNDLCWNILTGRLPIKKADLSALKLETLAARELAYKLRGKGIPRRRRFLENNPQLTRLLVKYGLKYSGDKVRANSQRSSSAGSDSN